MRPEAITIGIGIVAMLLGQATEITAPAELGWIGQIVQGGATALLVWMLWHVFNKLLPAQQEQLKEQQKAYSETLDRIMDRHDKWEIQRHADSERLDSTLTQLRVTCARTQAAIRGTPPPAIDAEGV